MFIPEQKIFNFQYFQIWLFIISGMLWNINSAGFLIFLNDYIIQNTNMDKDEAALGVTIIGNIFANYSFIYIQLISKVQLMQNIVEAIKTCPVLLT